MIPFSIFLSFCCLNITPAHAGLGDDTSAIERDRVRMGAKTSTSENQTNFNVQTLTNDGIKIREYISKSTGKIFAITWNGNTHPDLKPLLGQYFDEFKTQNQAMKTSPTAIKFKSRISRSSVVGDNVIVERSGHMRHLRGKVYLPKLMPAGVTLNEIF